MFSQRSLRSSKLAQSSDSVPAVNASFSSAIFTDGGTSQDITLIATGSKLPRISSSDLKLLKEKQLRLKETHDAIEGATSNDVHLRRALAPTLIFAQYEAGTAVCVDPRGYVLTCSHCFGESEEEQEANKHKWLLFYTGQAVLVECRVLDPKRDLALAKIIAVECEADQVGQKVFFASIALSPKTPSPKARIVCIGQPGRDDLESTSARKTTYNLVEASNGNLRGMIEDADPQDNSDIGALKHDAWTYWGHSGAPLVNRTDGTLVGLHSSWDDRTAMRHGVPWVAIRDFLAQAMPSN